MATLEPYLAAWPSIRDVARQLDVSETYARRLVLSGRLRAVETRLGRLVDPASVATYVAEHAPRSPRAKHGMGHSA